MLAQWGVRILSTSETQNDGTSNFIRHTFFVDVLFFIALQQKPFLHA